MAERFYWDSEMVPCLEKAKVILMVQQMVPHSDFDSEKDLWMVQHFRWDFEMVSCLVKARVISMVQQMVPCSDFD
jgi:hypothetical protein